MFSLDVHCMSPGAHMKLRRHADSTTGDGSKATRKLIFSSTAATASSASASEVVAASSSQRIAFSDVTNTQKPPLPPPQQQKQVPPAVDAPGNATTKRIRHRRPRSSKITAVKVLVVGNAKCGKTSIIRRYCHDEFDTAYTTTIGADYHRRVVKHPGKAGAGAGRKTLVQLWDIAGQDRFAALTRAFYANAKAAVVVFDVTRTNTLEAAKVWKQSLDDKLPGLPTVLLANKVDLLASPVDSFIMGAEIERVCKEYGFIGWCITSAATNTNIDSGINQLLSCVRTDDDAHDGSGSGDDHSNTSSHHHHHDGPSKIVSLTESSLPTAQLDQCC